MTTQVRFRLLAVFFMIGAAIGAALASFVGKYYGVPGMTALLILYIFLLFITWMWGPSKP